MCSIQKFIFFLLATTSTLLLAIAAQHNDFKFDEKTDDVSVEECICICLQFANLYITFRVNACGNDSDDYYIMHGFPLFFSLSLNNLFRFFMSNQPNQMRSVTATTAKLKRHNVLK